MSDDSDEDEDDDDDDDNDDNDDDEDSEDSEDADGGVDEDGLVERLGTLGIARVDQSKRWSESPDSHAPSNGSEDLHVDRQPHPVVTGEHPHT